MGNALANLDTVRLDLPREEWIEVKAELSWGEEQRLIGGGIGRVNTDNPVTTIDLAEYNLRRAEAWLTEWSLKDANGDPLPVSRLSIESLSSRIGRQIHQALDRHIQSMEGNASSPEATPGPAESLPESSSSASSSGAEKSRSARRPK